MKSQQFGQTLLIGVVTVAIAACSQSASVAPKPTPTRTPPCLVPLLPLATLYYPAPSATSVPVNAGEIIVGPPDDGAYALVAAGASPVAIAPAGGVPSPAPTALATGHAYYAVPLPTLSPNTSYSITYTAPQRSASCAPEEQSGTLGSFTTS